MIDIINIFLSIFAGIVSLFSDLEIGDYSYGSMIFGGFVIGIVFVWILGVLRRR